METGMIPAEPVQNLDSKASQRIADCLDNPLILKELLEHFSDPELLELSLVNKMWNYEARSVIKKHGKLQAFIIGCYSGYPCQQELEDFGADLEKMNVVPYSRVHMIICATDHTRESPLDLSKKFLARLPLKQLKVLLDGKRWYCTDCPAVLVLQKLFQDFSGILEKITLNIEKARAKFIQHFVQDCSFPALKILKLRDDYNTEHEAYTSYMRALVARAPNLQELHVSGPINLMVNVLEGSAAVLIYENTVYAPFNDISDETASALIVKRVVLVYPDADFSYDRFNRITPVLLQASCKTVHFMNIDAVFAVSLMCY